MKCHHKAHIRISVDVYYPPHDQRIGPNALALPPKFSRSLCKNKVRHLIVEDFVDVVSCTFSLSNGALYSFYDIGM